MKWKKSATSSDAHTRVKLRLVYGSIAAFCRAFYFDNIYTTLMCYMMIIRHEIRIRQLLRFTYFSHSSPNFSLLFLWIFNEYGSKCILHIIIFRSLVDLCYYQFRRKSRKNSNVRLGKKIALHGWGSGGGRRGV